MIDRTHALPVVRQCQLLKLSRSTAYYQPTPVSAAELALMRRIDELHLSIRLPGPECCVIFYGERAMPSGVGTSRTLMRAWAWRPLYRKPSTQPRGILRIEYIPISSAS